MVLLPLREKVARAAGRMRGRIGGSVSGAICMWSPTRPLIRQPSAATFSRKGRRV